MTAPNYGALSVWQQINDRPEFLRAFKGVNKLRNLYRASNPYERYFARNLHEFGYGLEQKARDTVLFNLDKDLQDGIWGDPVYGFA